MKRLIQHHLNPLHVYCRFCELGMSQDRAWKWAKKWEKWIKRK